MAKPSIDIKTPAELEQLRQIKASLGGAEFITLSFQADGKALAISTSFECHTKSQYFVDQYNFNIIRDHLINRLRIRMRELEQ